jgi:hypothetical protein
LNTQDGAERTSEELANHLTNHNRKPENQKTSDTKRKTSGFILYWNYTLSEEIWKELLTPKPKVNQNYD